MPTFETPSGTTTRVPGVYLLQNVERYGALPLDQIIVPVVIGRGDFTETMYDVVAQREVHETNLKPWQFIGNASAAEKAFGVGSEIAEAMRNAALHGFSSAYVVVANDVSRASVTALSTGPVEQFKLSARRFGTPGGYQKVTWTGSVLTLQGVKRFWKVAEDIAIADTRIYIDHTRGLAVGTTLTLGDNNSVVELVEVAGFGSYIQADGQAGYYVDLVAGTAGAFTVSQYAQIVEYDAPVVATEGTEFEDCETLIEWIRSKSEHFTATKSAGFTNAYPVALTIKLMKEISVTWQAEVAGTSPAIATAAHDDIIALFTSPGLEAFHADTAAMPSLFLVLDVDADMHELWAAFTRTRRAFGFPAWVVVGGAWGDSVLDADNDEDPKFRAQALDCQDVLLCAPGWNRRGAYLTAAPMVWAYIAGGGVGHNLTNDAIKFAEPEVSWDEASAGELTSLLQGGVCTFTYMYRQNRGYVIAQGISTLSSNTLAWNEDTGDTPLMHQRILADAIERAVADTLATFIGADEVDLTDVATDVLAVGIQLTDLKGWVEAGSFRIDSLTEDGDAGFNIRWRARPRRTRDYIGSTFTVIVGAEE